MIFSSGDRSTLAASLEEKIRSISAIENIMWHFESAIFFKFLIYQISAGISVETRIVNSFFYTVPGHGFPSSAYIPFLSQPNVWPNTLWPLIWPELWQTRFWGWPKFWPNLQPQCLFFCIWPEI